MATVAVERDTGLERDLERAEDRSAAEPRRPADRERSWLERQALRFVRWDWRHPHSLYLRTQHKLALTYFRLGFGRFDADMIVTTTGRTSGLPRHVVMGAIPIDERLYALNPFGERAHWYRNLLADPIATLQRQGRTWTARASRVTDRGEAAMLYERGPRSTLRWLLWVEGIADEPEVFAGNIDRFHIIRFDEVDEPGPPPLATDLTWTWPVAGAVGVLALLAKLRLRVALVGTVAAIGAVTILRGRDFVDRLTELTTSRPSGPIGRRLYRDATSMHGEGWRICHERLALKPKDRLLDVGCGGGTFLSQALKTVDQAAGLDHSPDMVALTRENNARAVADGRLDVRLGDAAALPWDDASFDAVSNLAAFMLAADPEAIVREAARVLKPGGRFVVVTMARPERDDLGARAMRWLLPHANLYSDEELARLLRDAGFDEIEAYCPDGDFQVGYGIIR